MNRYTHPSPYCWEGIAYLAIAIVGATLTIGMLVFAGAVFLRGWEGR